MAFKYLVVGLGNPEGKYNNTYHNLGFAVADMLANKFEVELKKKGNQLVAKYNNVLLLKPLTYMNLSGQAVVAVMRKHKILPENIIVICDDLNIDKGNIRITLGGSGGGHNGLRSVTDLLGTDKYIRIRVGIKPVKEPTNMADYVLARLDKESEELIQPALDNARQAVIEIINGAKFEITQGKYNVKNK